MADARWGAASELERDSYRLAGEGHETYLSGPRIRIALARASTHAWRSGCVSESSGTPGLVQAATTVEPFALRALGFARGDDDLLVRADELFASLGMEWHRAQTARLLAGA